MRFSVLSIRTTLVQSRKPRWSSSSSNSSEEIKNLLLRKKNLLLRIKNLLLRIKNLLLRMKIKTKIKRPPFKIKLGKALLTVSGILMMLISQEPSIRKKPRSSFKKLTESSTKRLSMRFSVIWIRITLVQSRKPKWSYSSSDS